MAKLSFLRNEALLSFLRLVALFLVPFFVALIGLALLTNLLTAFLWVAIIASVAYAYVRFYHKHNEHPEFDDHLSPEAYSHGLENYLKLLPKHDEDRAHSHSSS